MVEGTNCTFSVRFRTEDFAALTRYAGFRSVSVADQARTFLLDGLRDALDPAEIERQMDEEKHRLLGYARELRGEA
ncbi:hypothetical protein [Nocardia gipuzkoensis]|uniref:hypothetical protein n=1 Tax=Nocardia gipuzkoensis TaxID=2749991 RepID=UPI00237DAAE8|nr:hypothetical protein [Nocardia gipuzkoensis]MDE1673828.1 hypothetical protein [Nocardia gipuzkoensis]